MRRSRNAGPRLIDVALAEIEVPGDADVLPDRNVDRGVVPWAMGEYLKRADAFPVAPTLAWRDPGFRVLEGGRCLWAARQAGWQRPIRAVLVADPAEVPDGLWRRTLPLSRHRSDEAPAGAARPQVLCLSRPASAPERHLVEDAVHRLAALCRERNLLPFSQAADLDWPRPDTLCWRTPGPDNSEDRAGAVELYQTLAGLRAAGVPILAHNGRRCP